MKKALRWIGISGALIVLLGLFVVGAINKPEPIELTGNYVSPLPGADYQEVKVSFENYGYLLEPSTLKAGVPVRMTADLGSLYGCMRDIRIPQFGVSKYVSNGDNTIEFVPDKTGTFNIMCSMNMGRGTFNVV
jgi:plastocyanin domain-containing protein